MGAVFGRLSGPGDIIAVGEVFALGGGDEGGGSWGFRSDEVESGFEGIEESRVKAVLIVAG